MIIYKVTCLVNNKIYIGKTIYPLNKRKTNHLSEARKKRNKSILHDAICRYGEDSFVWEVIDEVLFSESLIELEKYYIKKFKSRVPNGYNITVGGEGYPPNFQSSIESRKKMSISAKNKPPMTEETKKKMSESSMGNKNPNYGKHWSDEHKKKLSDKKIGKKLSEETRRKIGMALLGKKRGKYNIIKDGEV